MKKNNWTRVLTFLPWRVSVANQREGFKSSKWKAYLGAARKCALIEGPLCAVLFFMNPAVILTLSVLRMLCVVECMRTLILTFGKFWFYHPIATLQIDCIECFTITTTSVETEIRKSMIWIVATAHFSWLLISDCRLLDRLCYSSISCHLINCWLRIHRRSSLTILCLSWNMILNWDRISFKRQVLFCCCDCWKCRFFRIWKI